MDERPGLYVKLEVGVSWPRHVTKRRSISYTSGGLKGRQQRALPAAAPALNAATNTRQTDLHPTSDQAYLQHVYNYASQSNYVSEQPYWHHRHAVAPPQEAVRPALPPSNHTAPVQDQLYVPYHPAQRQHELLPLCGEAAPRRRASPSPHSNGRGSSAPPPTHDRPWDASPEPMTSMAIPRWDTTSAPRAHTWKPLPATPGEFRLGDNAMPWSGSPDPADYSAAETSRRGQAETSKSPATYSAKTPSQRSADDRERGRTVEMQSLATALMTVDNGFEDQWWFQGPRMTTIAGDLIPPAPLRDMYDQASDNKDYSAGPHFQTNTPASTIVDLVSPLSGHSSPMSGQSHQDP